MADQERLLRAAFLAGAITDALALVPMLIPAMAKVLWGFDAVSGACRFAMGYGAAGFTEPMRARRPAFNRGAARLTVTAR